VRIKIEITVDCIIYIIPNYTQKHEKIRKGLTLKIKTSLTVVGPLTEAHQPTHNKNFNIKQFLK
jgi:hypothetical protein